MKRAADLLEQWYSMSGNPHHFALPTPPSDHEGETSKFICLIIINKKIFTFLFIFFLFIIYFFLIKIFPLHF